MCLKIKIQRINTLKWICSVDWNRYVLSISSFLPGCRRADSPGLDPAASSITNSINWILPLPAVAGQNSLSHLHSCHLLCILETSFHTRAVPQSTLTSHGSKSFPAPCECKFLNFRIPYPFSGCVRGLQTRFHWVPVAENSLCSVEIPCSLLVPGVVRPLQGDHLSVLQRKWLCCSGVRRKL